MDVYWLEAWLVESSHGLHARGLLGAVTHLLSKGGPDVIVLNVITMGISAAITATLIALLYLKSTTVWSRLAIAVLAASPLCALFFEEVGDPLMVVFAVFLITVAGIRLTTSKPLRILLSVLFCLVAVAVHEASLFLYVPAIVLISFTPQRLDRAAFVRYALVAIPLLLLIVLDNAPRVSNPDYRAVNSITGSVIPRIEVPFPSYMQLAREEAAIYFATPVKALQFVLKFPRVWCIELLCMVLVTGLILRGDSARAFWRNWLYLSICSAPLYVIAVDWGRFSTITFWLSLIALWVRQEKATTPAAEPRPLLIRLIVPERMPAEGIVFGVVAGLILAANALYPDYGINGMPAISLPIVIPTLIAWAAWRAWSTSTT
jgi:hypothetical protein